MPIHHVLNLWQSHILIRTCPIEVRRPRHLLSSLKRQDLVCYLWLEYDEVANP
jgi:hypothetical protein